MWLKQIRVTTVLLKYISYLCVLDTSCWSEWTLQEDTFEMRVHKQLLLGETSFWDLGLFWIFHLTYSSLNKWGKIGCKFFSIGVSFCLVSHGLFFFLWLFLYVAYLLRLTESEGVYTDFPMREAVKTAMLFKITAVNSSPLRLYLTVCSGF